MRNSAIPDKVYCVFNEWLKTGDIPVTVTVLCCILIMLLSLKLFVPVIQFGWRLPFRIDDNRMEKVHYL